MARGWKPGRIRLGPAAGVPFTGMAGGKLANLVGPGEATSATNVDTREGVIKALYGPGSTVSALSASKQHLHYEDNLGWYDATEDSWHTYDSKGNGGTYSFFNVGSTPYYSNGTSHQKALGLTAPGSAATQTTGGGTARYFRYTYVTNGTTYAPMESNPSPVSASLSSTVVSCTGTTDAAVATIYLYATVDATTTDGPYYYVGSVANPGTATGANVTPTVSTSTSATVLGWDAAGRSTQAYYNLDHSPAPSVNTLGTALHAATVGGQAVAPCSGILFASSSSYLRWSQAGYPWYWPTLNWFNAGGYIEAVVTDQAITYVLTRREIYVVTGYDDQALTIQRSSSPFGTVYGASACITPHGLVFQAEAGLAIFDGNTSRIISGDAFSPSELYGRQMATAWRDGQLLMICQNDGNGGYVVDFDAFPALKATKHNLDYRGITQAITHADGSTHTEGTYVIGWSSGSAKKWHPKQRTNVSGAAQQAWTWVTGALDAGKPTATKRFVRIWVESSGTISIAAKCYTNAATQVGSTATITASSWLPANFIGDYLQLTITSSDGTGVLNGITVEFEAME